MKKLIPLLLCASALFLVGAHVAVPNFTLPFVLATWIVLRIPARAPAKHA